jgi:hypothetical protein|tara:strand:+ start:247 stop:444 length:198 start_codon:yes stop_codon:yes gene_type:complete
MKMDNIKTKEFQKDKKWKSDIYDAVRSKIVDYCIDDIEYLNMLKHVRNNLKKEINLIEIGYNVNK